MNWLTLKNGISEKQPYLEKMFFGSKDDDEHFPFPPLLSANSFAAINLFGKSSEPGRLAIILPHSETIACFIAAAAAFAGIAKQEKNGFSILPPLLPGEKVLLDGVDYIYQGEENFNGEPFMVFDYKGGVQKVPVRERFRVQHSVSTRQLTKRDKKPIKSVVDPILGTNLRGNTSVFQTSVILLSGVTAVREQISELSIAASNDNCQKLANIFGWGSLTEDGEIKIWGSAGKKEEPLVLTSSNFADVCDYLEYNAHKTDLIVADGASFLKDLSSFETLLSKNIPIVFVFSGKDQEGVQYLKKKNFAFWAWNSEDLKSVCQDSSEKETSPFYHILKNNAAFASFDVKIIECVNAALDGTFDLLNFLRHKINKEDYHASQILDRLFVYFLKVSRLVSLTDSISEKCGKELVLIEDELKTFRFQIDPKLCEVFGEVIELLKQTKYTLSDAESKPSRMRSEIGKLLAQGKEKICVVLSKSDFQTESDYLSNIFPRRRVSFQRNSTFKKRDDYDCVILCGYLKRSQMLRIFDEALGTELTILNYAHEKDWTTSVKKQFFGIFNRTTFRNHSVFGKQTPSEITSPEEKSDDNQIPALEEFEVKLHEFKKQRVLREIGNESEGQKVSARCIMFNQGSFAFLTDSYSVPVINELVGSGKKIEKIPQKKIKDILPGDFLLFRESSDRNLIKEIADLGLGKSGKSNLRSVSSQWREALRKLYERCGGSLSEVKNELKKYDCDRNELTIKNWLFDENQIAPGEDADILAIAAAAGGGELVRNYDNVINAVRQVRGAHIQAAHRVAGLIKKRVKGELYDLSEAHVEMKIAGLGKVFVVCVESIDSEKTEVPGHKANKLLEEKRFENGTNDTSASVG